MSIRWITTACYSLVISFDGGSCVSHTRMDTSSLKRLKCQSSWGGDFELCIKLIDLYTACIFIHHSVKYFTDLLLSRPSWDWPAHMLMLEWSTLMGLSYLYCCGGNNLRSCLSKLQLANTRNIHFDSEISLCALAPVSLRQGRGICVASHERLAIVYLYRNSVIHSSSRLLPHQNFKP